MSVMTASDSMPSQVTGRYHKSNPICVAEPYTFNTLIVILQVDLTGRPPAAFVEALCIYSA